MIDASTQNPKQGRQNRISRAIKTKVLYSACKKPRMEWKVEKGGHYVPASRPEKINESGGVSKVLFGSCISKAIGPGCGRRLDINAVRNALCFLNNIRQRAKNTTIITSSTQKHTERQEGPTCVGSSILPL